MTSLKSLIVEEHENRVNLTRIEVNVEHVAQQLDKKEQEKLALAYLDLKLMGDTLNTIPRTAFNGNEWRWLNFVWLGKVAALRIVVEDIASENEKVDCRPLMGALDLLLIS